MTHKKLVKALHKHINNGHDAEKMVNWWNRFNCGEQARIEGEEVIFPSTTVSGKKEYHRLRIW